MNEALKQLEALLANAAAQPPRFAANSRYNAVPVLELTLPDGRKQPYVARRLVPSPEVHAVFREHAVVQGDRLDLLAWQLLGDPEQWWKIADANLTLAPDTLTDVVGTKLRLAVPDGFVGVPPGAAPQA